MANTKREDNGLGELNYPLATDTNHQVTSSYGILIEEEGVALRGLFIISPDVVFHNITSVEMLTKHYVCALQTGGLYPANWKSGQKNL